MTAPLDSLLSPPRPGLCVEKGPSVLSSRPCSRASSASGRDSGAKCNNLCAGARSFGRNSEIRNPPSIRPTESFGNHAHGQGTCGAREPEGDRLVRAAVYLQGRSVLGAAEASGPALAVS